MSNKISPQSKNIIALLAILLLAVVVTLLMLDDDSLRFSRSKSVLPQSNGYLSSTALTIDSADIFAGSEQAQLAIIVYENYLDPFSQALNTSLEAAVEEFDGDLLFVYRPFVPQGNLLAQEVAELLLCSHDQKKGLEARQWLLAQASQGEFSLEDLDVYTTDLSLDGEELAVCLSEGRNQEVVADMMRLAEAADVYGSPTLVVGNELLLGAVPYLDFIDSNGDQIEGLRSVIIRQLNK